MNRPPMRPTGFSLLELLISLAVLALLSSVALPSYQQYLQRSYRSEARTGLLQAAQWMERAATASGSYPLTADFPAPLRSTPSGRYTIELLSPPNPTQAGTAYLLTARAQGTQASDRCGHYTLTHHSVRGAAGSTTGALVNDCWNR
ncbi:MAG: type IV pilin protein [Burkholderiaceae bacterium]|nr:type IV pilin protein [Burkholderiaceae bacterium]